ncbi:TOM1-like protein 5 [Nymphaea colorata]|nr:TOM1-like protein 5 [Nymphaea colorata]
MGLIESRDVEFLEELNNIDNNPVKDHNDLLEDLIYSDDQSGKEPTGVQSGNELTIDQFGNEPTEQELIRIQSGAAVESWLKNHRNLPLLYFFWVSITTTISICRSMNYLDRKGKACAQAWREDPSESSSNSSDSFILENLPPPPPPPFWSSLREAQESEPIQAAPVIPPPPAKSKERDLFFKEKETAAPGKIGVKLGGLSLRKRNGNGSQSGSMKFNE